MRSRWGKVIEHRNGRGFSLEPCATFIGHEEHVRSTRGIAQLPDLIRAGVQNFTRHAYIIWKIDSYAVEETGLPIRMPDPHGESQ
jgi:hypothetical protein